MAVARTRDTESWEGGGTRVRGQPTLAASGLQYELPGRVAQPELRATLSEGLVVSCRRENKGVEASLRGKGEAVSVVSVKKNTEREREVTGLAEAVLWVEDMGGQAR